MRIKIDGCQRCCFGANRENELVNHISELYPHLGANLPRYIGLAGKEIAAAL